MPELNMSITTYGNLFFFSYESVFSSSIINYGVPFTPHRYRIIVIHLLITIVVIPPPKPPSGFPTVNVLGRFVGIVLYNHLDEVHALNNETFKGHPLSSRSEDVADGKFQRTMDEWYKSTWVVLQEI